MKDTRSAEPGQLLIIAGPQGVGKSYAAERLCAMLPATAIARGVTTQALPEDANDEHVSRELFGQLLGGGELCMVMELWGHYYGYFNEPILASLSEGWTVVMMLLFARDVREAMRIFTPSTAVYLRPAQWKLVEERLMLRDSVNEPALDRVIANNICVVRELDLFQWGLIVDVTAESDPASEIATYFLRHTR